MSDERNRLIREGFIAGLLGYGAVVALFAILNLVAGLSPFHTASVLGSALLGSALDQAGPLGPVLAYNGLHLVVSILLGIGASFLANQAEADHDLGSGVVFGLLALGGWIPIFFGAITVEYLHAVGWAEVLAGSLVGAGAILAYIGWAHRDLVQALFEEAQA
ncbi:MAG: hypothetical protein JSU98_03655 [Gemmatimonadales bacterium]|nr:MAG: hypothetical protein JSU98_03655 [Gemmatimonadales bacterium]